MACDELGLEEHVFWHMTPRMLIYRMNWHRERLANEREALAYSIAARLTGNRPTITPTGDSVLSEHDKKTAAAFF
jgi:hypothetical protein